MSNLLTIDTLVYLATNVFRIYVVYRFAHIFFDTNKRKTNASIEFLCFAAYFIINSGTYLLMDNAILNIITNVIPFFLITFIFSSKVSTKLLATFILYPIQMVAEVIVYFPLVAISNGASIDTLTSIISTLLFFVLSLVAGRMSSKQDKAELASSRWLALLSIPIGSIIIAVVLFLEGNNSIWISLAGIFLLAINFTTFYLYETMIRFYLEESEKKLLLQQNLAYQRQFDLIEKNQDKIRTLRHDLKNQLNSMRSLLKVGQSNEAIKYLDGMDSFIESGDNFVHTDNPHVDSILNYKIAEAKNNGITVETDILIPTAFHIDPFSLNVVIGNLMDNAIEASTLVGNKQIRFVMRVDASTLLIKVENTYEEEPFFGNGEYITQKPNAEFHGFGMKSVGSIIEKYNGKMDVAIKDKHFVVTVFMYLTN